MNPRLPLLLLVVLPFVAVSGPVAAEHDPDTSCYFVTDTDAVTEVPCERVPCTQVECSTMVFRPPFETGGYYVLPPRGLHCTVVARPPSVSCDRPSLGACQRVDVAATIRSSSSASSITVTGYCASEPGATCIAFGPNGQCTNTDVGRGAMPRVCRWVLVGPYTSYTARCNFV